MSNTAVLIHGCHLETDGWETVAMGDLAKGSLGRISKGLLVAHQSEASLVYFGTGASRKEGKLESEYTFETAMQHWRELAAICDADDGGGDPYDSLFLQWLQRVAEVDTETQNTHEEISRFLDMCVDRGVTKPILVSSPFHAPRCLQTAQVVFDRLTNDSRYDVLRRNLSVVASDTNPTGLNTVDVVIVEPAHRGDTPRIPFFSQVRRLFQFLRRPELAWELHDDLSGLIDKYEKRLKLH